MHVYFFSMCAAVLTICCGMCMCNALGVMCDGMCCAMCCCLAQLHFTQRFPVSSAVDNAARLGWAGLAELSEQWQVVVKWRIQAPTGFTDSMDQCSKVDM